MTCLAVIGGGVSGLMACRQALAENAFKGVHWFRGEAASLGVAYDTPCAAHLLNVPVERMGLDPAVPEGFLCWLQARVPGVWQAGDFVPRQHYGRYLREQREALERDPRLHVHATRASALRREGLRWQVIAEADSVTVDAVLLAPGLPLGRSPAPTGRPVVAEAWHWFHRLAPADAAGFAAIGPRILIAGSGLTAIDMVVGLRARGYRGAIDVRSPSGQWPLPHAPTAPLPVEVLDALHDGLRQARRATAVLATLRAAAAAHPWRNVLDALRPHSNALWAAWPEPLQRRLLRRAFSVWSHHRHRVPPQVLAGVHTDDGVQLRRGRVRASTEGVWLDGQPVRDYGLILLAAGPTFAAGVAHDGLLQGLLAEGVLQRHTLGKGLQVAAAVTALQLVGALRFGERFETTAVPDLRAQVGEAMRALTGR